MYWRQVTLTYASDFEILDHFDDGDNYLLSKNLARSRKARIRNGVEIVCSALLLLYPLPVDAALEAVHLRVQSQWLDQEKPLTLLQSHVAEPRSCFPRLDDGPSNKFSMPCIIRSSQPQ